jgi:hypothetical protein
LARFGLLIETLGNVLARIAPCDRVLWHDEMLMERSAFRSRRHEKAT